MPDSSNGSPSSAVNEEPQGDGGRAAKASKDVRIDLGDVTQHNVKMLKKVNTFVFPIVYQDNFYKDVLEAGELAKLAFYNDIVVGAVCCKVVFMDSAFLRRRRCQLELVDFGGRVPSPHGIDTFRFFTKKFGDGTVSV